MIRACTKDDFETILAIINDSAAVYQGVIPPDCWHLPYMAANELAGEIAVGVSFSGFEEDGALIAVMGSQPVCDVILIRHAYVRPGRQRRGVGAELLLRLTEAITRPVLIGTWKDARWAIRFYEKHGFRLVAPEAEKDRLLMRYWDVPPRQVATSVVLGDQRWFDLR